MVNNSLQKYDSFYNETILSDKNYKDFLICNSQYSFDYFRFNIVLKSNPSFSACLVIFRILYLKTNKYKGVITIFSKNNYNIC